MTDSASTAAATHADQPTAELLRLIYECPADGMCGPCRRRIGLLAERAEQRTDEAARRDETFDALHEQVTVFRERAEQAEKERDQAKHERDEYGRDQYQQGVEDAKADRDRLAAALRPFAENWDFHAADYLADLVDGEEARVIPARVVNELIAAVKVAREALSPGATQEQTP